MRLRATLQQCAHRSERVVGDAPCPRQSPERLDGLLFVLGTGGFAQLRCEVRTAPGERVKNARIQRVRRDFLVGGSDGERRRIRRMKCHPPIATWDGAVARPHNLTAGREFVEHGGGVIAHAGGEDE